MSKTTDWDTLVWINTRSAVLSDKGVWGKVYAMSRDEYAEPTDTDRDKSHHVERMPLVDSVDPAILKPLDLRRHGGGDPIAVRPF